jgi:hypothetical protein
MMDYALEIKVFYDPISGNPVLQNRYYT